MIREGHTGPAQVRQAGTVVMLLCPVGHLVDSVRVGEDHGFALLARDGDTVTCHGKIAEGES